MKVRLKWVFTAILAVVVAALVAGYAYISSYDLNKVRAEIQAQAKKLTGRDLEVRGPIDLAISLTPAVAVEDLRFANAEWAKDPDMVALERFEIEIALLPLIFGDIQVNRVVLVGADIRLETNAQGEANWSFDVAETAQPAPEPQSEEAKAAASIPDVREVEIRDSRLTFLDGVSGGTVSVALDTVKALRDGDILALEAQGSYQDIGFVASGETGNLSLVASGADVPVNLRGEVAGAAFSLEGKLAKALVSPEPDLKFAVSGDSLADLNAFTGGEDLPRYGPYSVSGLLTGSGTVFRIDGLAVELGESDLGGNVSLDLSGPRPKLSGDLTSATVDLSKLPRTEGESQGASDGGDSPYVIPDTPLPLAGLNAADAAISLKIGVLRPQEGLELQNFTVTVKLVEGALEISPFSVELSGGTIGGNLGLDASRQPAKLDANFDIAKIDIGRLLREQDITRAVQASLDGKIDLSGSGGSPREIASSLNGRTEINSGQGKISSNALTLLATGLTQLVGPLFGGANEVTINCTVSRFDIRNGLMTSEALVFDSSTFSLVGAGTVDLKDESLKMQFRTSSRQPNLAALAVPFKLGGTLKNPKVEADAVGTAMKVGQIAGGVANPLAALGVLAGGQATGGGENPCVAALDKAASGEGSPGASPEPGQQQTPQSTQENIEDTVKGLGEGLKGLFKKN